MEISQPVYTNGEIGCPPVTVGIGIREDHTEGIQVEIGAVFFNAGAVVIIQQPGSGAGIENARGDDKLGAPVPAQTCRVGAHDGKIRAHSTHGTAGSDRAGGTAYLKVGKAQRIRKILCPHRSAKAEKKGCKSDCILHLGSFLLVNK